jgi:iron(III) transport system permease protein
MNTTLEKKFHPDFLLRILGVTFFAYLFFGFMLLPCIKNYAMIKLSLQRVE